MARIYDDVTALVGHTPLVRLNRVTDGLKLMAWGLFKKVVIADRLALMVTLWGGRLAVYLFWRNHGKGEDPRYQAMRRRYGVRFPLVSLFVVFGFQGAAMWTSPSSVIPGTRARMADSIAATRSGALGVMYCASKSSMSSASSAL